MEHMISDAFSINILSRDLFATYMQLVKGRDALLPGLPAQFSDYAVWQRNGHKSWIEVHGAYWSERLTECQRLRFPEDKALPTGIRLGWGRVPLHIGRELKAELSEWSRLRGTTLVMSVFTAFVGLVLRWCGVSKGMFQYQSDGRDNPKIENTIGFFAAVLYLRIELLDNDSFVDLMRRVAEEYCKAYEHADFSYMAAQVPPPEFTRNSAFNWVPQGLTINSSDLANSGEAVTCVPISFEHPMLRSLERDHEPSVGFIDTDDGIVGGVSFPLNRFSADTMERFGANFIEFIKALLRHSAPRVRDIVLV
jgi:hypothetical protein